MSDLETAIGKVAQARAVLDGAGGCKDGADYHAWRERVRIAEAAARRMLEAAGAKITDGSGSTTTLSCAGMRSTSTMGLPGAVSNWLTAARARSAAQ